MTYVIIWEFEVRPGLEAEFERAYGPDGDWARLFRQGSGYRGTELLRHGSHPRVYVTIDRWDSANAFARFRSAHDAEYRALDARCEGWTARERKVGEFATLP